MLLVLHSSKMHTKGEKPQIIKISSYKSDKGTNLKSFLPTDVLRVCPYDAIRKYIKVRKSFRAVNEPFFVYRDRTPVNPDILQATLTKAITNLGLNPSYYFSMQSMLAMPEISSKWESLLKLLRNWVGGKVMQYMFIYVEFVYLCSKSGSVEGCVVCR